VFRSYAERNLRYSNLAPLTMFKEVNTGDNLPAQIDLYATDGDEYEFLYVAKGGGSANKTFLFQETPSRLTPDGLLKFLDEKIKTLGTAACPPYHLAVVVGGTSAEFALKTLKLATCRYLDGLPSEGNKWGQAFRDREMEEKVHKLTQMNGIGAQFGGKYFCHDVRVVRLPRHGASLPIAIGVSCSADRQALGKVTRDGVFLEQLETDPAQYMPDVDAAKLGGDVVRIDLNQPMSRIREILSGHAVTTRVMLTGPLIVARDLAHAKLRADLEAGKPLPEYFRNHPIYYAGPAKTPKGYASGAFGPTTAGRMDSFVDQFQAAGGSYVMVAKGNRSKVVTDACRKHGGFYLCSVGGEGAVLAQDCIKKVECIAYPELGMEAIWRIEVVDFPAFIVVDDKGNDFFAKFGAY
jgi:fumarate hydratase class I